MREQTRENIIVRCSPGKENKYDTKTTTISTKSDNIKVNVQMDTAEMGEAGTVKASEADGEAANSDVKSNVGSGVVSHNTTGNSSVMDWSPGEPASPSGASSTTACSNMGLGPNMNNMITPKSRNIAEHGAKQHPGP